MRICSGLTKAAKAGQKSLVPAQRAQRAKQGRTPFICTTWVPISLSFNSQQGPALSSLSVSNPAKSYTTPCKLLASVVFQLLIVPIPAPGGGCDNNIRCLPAMAPSPSLVKSVGKKRPINIEDWKCVIRIQNCWLFIVRNCNLKKKLSIIGKTGASCSFCTVFIQFFFFSNLESI